MVKNMGWPGCITPNTIITFLRNHIKPAKKYNTEQDQIIYCIARQALRQNDLICIHVAN